MQELPSLHESVAPGRQTPPRQVSMPLQTLSSGQNQPSGRGVPGLQTWFWQNSTPLHSMPSWQRSPSREGAPAVQVPF